MKSGKSVLRYGVVLVHQRFFISRFMTFYGVINAMDGCVSIVAQGKHATSAVALEHRALTALSDT